MGWASERVMDRPLKDTILADTGQMGAVTGIPMTVIVWTMRDCNLVIVKRDALNATDLFTQRLNCDAGTEEFPLASMSFGLSERLVVRCLNDTDDMVQVSIIW